MSMPVSQQPPAETVSQQTLNFHSTHSSVGPAIAVLVVIMVLCIVAIMIGRLCSGRRIMSYGRYDVEGWAERKCSSCIDGRISPPPPRHSTSNTSTPASTPAQPNLENKQPEQSSESTNLGS
ncbi:hypothetical protein K2173_028039 [Erythroxylum novogranatense]|uniref:Uncharacterized protein n=1 Tax=Erythroxylum novogranatense TaxID=1862640 RepID=A0AAV8TXA5_9ROSI|nr:hypothetical protein K2173_026734 [Erythroxylum novogranatense]KAJ8772862.1 hypothetical protein K2173_028039 [Erythroxylum novogranatense]